MDDFALFFLQVYSPSKTLKSLWDAMDLPEKQPEEKGWGPKISAVWSWKNQLPAIYLLRDQLG
jgi:hypothetical protein